MNYLYKETSKLEEPIGRQKSPSPSRCILRDYQENKDKTIELLKFTKTDTNSQSEPADHTNDPSGSCGSCKNPDNYHSLYNGAGTASDGFGHTCNNYQTKGTILNKSAEIEDIVPSPSYDQANFGGSRSKLFSSQETL